MKTISNERFGEERALYNSRGIRLVHCAFDGAEDGESALKESEDISVEDTYCNLRYPFWHDRCLRIRNSELTECCRAPLWYSHEIEIVNTKLHGVKALRECSDVDLISCEIVSPEFGWSVKRLRMRDDRVTGEYFLLRSEDIALHGVELNGKYSFQYVKNAVLEDCVLHTKDAFWHAENVTLRNCVVEGEYLAWYSERVTMIDCTIRGTQPFCYCKDLTLVNCEMWETDLAFERSSVTADVTTPIVSIKNPCSGRISAPAIGRVIMDDERSSCRLQISGQ